MNRIVASNICQRRCEHLFRTWCYHLGISEDICSVKDDASKPHETGKWQALPRGDVIPFHPRTERNEQTRALHMASRALT